MLALSSGALVRPLFQFRLIRSKAETCPHGRVIAQSLLAPLMVVVAFQNIEMSRDEGMVETSWVGARTVRGGGGRLEAVKVTIGVPQTVL